MKKIIYLLGFLTLAILVSCEQAVDGNEITDDATKLVKITGQWEVNAYSDSTLVYGPFKIITLKDPSIENDSITVQDSEVKFWKFQVKASVDEKNGTFQTRLSQCEISEEGIGVIISNGMIVDSDSIYLEIQFEDDETPYGNIYQLKGRRSN